MALAKDRNTPKRTGNFVTLPVAAASLIYQGAIVCINAAGFSVPGRTAADLKTVGVARSRADNSQGADGMIAVEADKGWFRFDNSAGADAIATADIGGTAYVVDDHTVAKTSGGATRSAAGTIKDVDAVGVWVDFN